MKIDKRLNLVIPVETDGVTVYVHSSPISRETFENYFFVIAKTFAAIYGEGLGFLAGPRVASMILKSTATELKVWEGPVGVQNGLMNEIRRLTNVLSPIESGWGITPFQESVDKELLSTDDMSEVENALIFFMVASSMHKKKELPGIMEGACSIWGAETTLLNSTEYGSFLRTSTKAVDTGTKATPSLIPS